MSDSEVDLGFSMRMDDSQPESEIPPHIFTIRPDTKGPKSIGVLLVLGALGIVWSGLWRYRIPSSRRPFR